MSSKSDCCCTCLKASFLLFSVHFSDLFCCCCLWLCSLSFLASPRSIIMIQLSRYAEDVVMLEPRFKGKKLFEYHLYSEWLQFPPLSNYKVYAGLEDDSSPLLVPLLHTCEVCRTRWFPAAKLYIDNAVKKKKKS